MKKNRLLLSFISFVVLCNLSLAQSNKDTISITLHSGTDLIDAFTLTAFQTHKIDSTNLLERYFYLILNNNTQDTIEIITNNGYFNDNKNETEYYWDFSRESSQCDSLGITLIPYYKMKFTKVAPKETYQYTINYKHFKDCPSKIGNRFYVKFYYRKTYTNIVFDKDTGQEFQYKDWTDLMLIGIANYPINKK